MKNKKTILMIFLVFLLTPSFADAATENLDEIFSRKVRLPDVNWGPALLEDSANNFTWQAETLQYDDVATNNEVWKITSTPASLGGQTQDISITHWGADGNRVLFHSKRSNKAYPIRGYVNFEGSSYVSILGGGSNAGNSPANPAYWKKIPYDASYPTWGVGFYYDPVVSIWMLTNTDGSRLKPAYGAASQSAYVDAYVLWSPTLADVLYQGAEVGGLAPNALYRVSVSDSIITRSSFISLPPAVTRTQLKKSISGDGTKVIIQDTVGNWYVATVFPEAEKNLDTPNGYLKEFNFDYYWGNQSIPWSGYHDRFLTGAQRGIDGIWNYIMPENTSGSWWRARVVGSGLDAAPQHISDQTPPYDWGGEIEPVNTVSGLHDPWCPQDTVFGTDCVEYLSHFTPDRWGHYGISTKSGNSPYGTSIYNLRDHKYSVKGFTGVSSPFWSQHHDWEAWSDWSTSSGTHLMSVYDFFRVTTQNFRDIASQKTLAFAHVRENGDTTPYESLTRPIQSPDGTKVMFNSTFLNNSDSDVQLFWTVAYYPYAPEIKSAAKNGGNVNLVWDFNQGLNCSNDAGTSPRTGPTPNLPEVNGIYPRTYATRGWPHETLDCAPSPREIKDFRIWSSDNNINWTPIATIPYSNCKGTNECGMWTENSWNFDATQANNTTKYYAITSLEHSGLESHTLSNTWKISTDGTGNIIENIEQNSYPADPGGKTTFFATSPDAPIPDPINFVTHDSGMQYTIKWNASTNKTLIRHYNIYALDGSLPTAIQQRRIASIPATSDYANSGSFKYIDWAGNSDGSTQYLVTSVDFQGNESGVVTSTDVTAPSAPSGLNVM